MMLIIITTHPIQYQTPIWQKLGETSAKFQVWFLFGNENTLTLDSEFGREINWDIDLLNGYSHRFFNCKKGEWPANFFRARFAGNVGKLLEETRATGVLVVGWQALGFWQALYHARRSGIPVFMRAESNDLGRNTSLKTALRSCLHKTLFRHIDKFLYIGKNNKNLYLKHGVKNQQLIYAPYCVDNQRFKSQAHKHERDRTSIRYKWGISDSAFCILFCGKLIEKKRPLDLIDAVQIVNAKYSSNLPKDSAYTHVHILFVGTGNLIDRIRLKCEVRFDYQNDDKDTQSRAKESQGQAKPLASIVGFLNQTEISQAYVACDGMALLSDSSETWGLVINEAYASGVPCIASKLVGSAVDLVAPVSNKLLFECGNLKEISDAICELLENPPSPEVLRQIIDEFRIEQTVDAIKSLSTRLKD